MPGTCSQVKIWSVLNREIQRRAGSEHTATSPDFDWSSIPATNIGFDVKETLEGLLRRPVV